MKLLHFKFQFRVIGAIICKTVTEKIQLIKRVFGKDFLSRSRMLLWFKRFQSGREVMWAN